nr:hypothetical protein [Tanacetum cinerariifolium]
MSSGIISNMLNPSPDTCIDSIFNLNTESTSLVDVSVTTTAETPLLSATTLPPPSTPLITHLQQTPVTSPANVPSSSPQDLINFGSFIGFDHRLKDLEDNFAEFMQTYQFAKAISSILENEDFINKLDENIKKIIKEQVKEPVKAQVSKILPKIKKTVNEQLKNEIILDTYGDTVTLKRRRDDADEDEEPSAGSDQGSKRRREGKELESTSALKENASKTAGKSTEGSKSHQNIASEFAPAEEPMQTTQVKKVVDKGKTKMVEDDHPVKKHMRRNKKIIIEENVNPSVMDSVSDNETDPDVGINFTFYSDSDSEYSDKSVDCLSQSEDELIDLRKRKTGNVNSFSANLGVFGIAY